MSETGPPREGRHDEHRPVARELPVRLLAERDGGAHLRLLHHHRLQRPERPRAAARLADHAVSAAGRGCRGWGEGVCAVPTLHPGSPTPGTRGPGGLRTPSPARSAPEWPGSLLPFLPVPHGPHPPWPMGEQHTSTPALPPGPSPPASTRGGRRVSPRAEALRSRGLCSTEAGEAQWLALVSRPSTVGSF